MKITIRLLLGIVAILPLSVSVLFIGSFIYIIQSFPEELFAWIIRYQFLVLVINFGLLLTTYGPVVYYIIHAGRNPDLADRKAVWIILMVFFGGFALPIYWFIFIWRDSYYEPKLAHSRGEM